MNSYEKLLRERVDPDGVLPHVVLKRAGVCDTDRRRYEAYAADGDVVRLKSCDSIGIVVLKRMGNVPWWCPAWMDLANKDCAGRGYGTSMYLAAAGRLYEAGAMLRSSDDLLSPDAKLVWDRLVAYGVAEAITPYVSIPGSDQFRGGEVRLFPEELLQDSSYDLASL
jgi:hypothetical protein